jgi:hypothetical protein
MTETKGHAVGGTWAQDLDTAAPAACPWVVPKPQSCGHPSLSSLFLEALGPPRVRGLGCWENMCQWRQ